jgi:hypothetical protein
MPPDPTLHFNFILYCDSIMGIQNHIGVIFFNYLSSLLLLREENPDFFICTILTVGRRANNLRKLHYIF